MKLIIAGDHRQFLEYCHRNNLDPQNTKEVREITSPKQMYGFDNGVEIVYFGTYLARKDFGEILDLACRYPQGEEMGKPPKLKVLARCTRDDCVVKPEVQLDIVGEVFIHRDWRCSYCGAFCAYEYITPKTTGETK